MWARCVPLDGLFFRKVLFLSFLKQGRVGAAYMNKDKDTCSKATMEKTVQTAVIEYFREIEDKLSSMRQLVEDTQLQQATDRRHSSKITIELLDALRLITGRLDKTEALLKEAMIDIESALRLEKAAAALQGQIFPSTPQYTETSTAPVVPTNPTGPASPTVISPPAAEVRAAATTATTEAAEGRGAAAAGRGAAAAAAPPSTTQRAAATGGLVELRGPEDFSRMLGEGDAWVVMFHAPWCVACAEALAEFQQAALQAPVHFARCLPPLHP